MGFIYDKENKTWTFIGSQELYDEFQKAVAEHFEYMKNKNKKKSMGKVVMISSPAKTNLDLMINKMAPAMNRQSIIIVHPSTWDELVGELLCDMPEDAVWQNSDTNGCSYRKVTVYRSEDYPVGQWGIYL